MSDNKRNKKKDKGFFTLHKWTIMMFALLVAVLIMVIIVFYNISKSPYDNVNDVLVSTNAKSVDDLTKNEKEILGTIDKKSEIEKVLEKSYSEEYQNYQNLTDEEKEKLEVVPRKEEIPLNEVDDIKEIIDYEDEDEIIPDSYNMKDYINIKVENQNMYGLCWDFASMKSLETNLLLHEGRDLDLSELHLDYYQSNLMYGHRQIHSGGNFSDFVDYSLLSGAVLEETVPYGYSSKSVLNGNEYSYYNLNDFKEEEYSKFTNMSVVARATEVVNFPSVRKTNGVADGVSDEELKELRNLIKTHLMKNGTLYTVIATPDVDREFYNSASYSEYFNGDYELLNPERSIHAVSIVGWDDNYSKDNFVNGKGYKPKNDGAYIVLNSWGENWGDKGYFYISYEDSMVESQLSGVVSTSMDNAIRIEDIQSQIVKDIIYDKLKYYIIDYNNDKYITKMALEKINSIELKNKKLTSDDLKDIDIFSNLFIIDLSNNDITDVSVLTNLKRLFSINLSNNNVKDVSSLKDLENLTNIYLSGNKNVTGYELLDNLTVLDLSNDDIVVLNDISKNDNLNHLVLSNNVKLDYANLNLPKNISFLSLDNTNFSSINLSNLKNLYSLSIKNNNLKNLDGLNNINSLTSLDVSNNEISDFSALIDIFRKSKNEDDIAEDELYGYYEYTSLIAKSNNISDISIINNIEVNSLDLSNNNITDLSNFNNSSIRMITLSYNKIKKGVGALKDVYSVYLDNCEISNLNGFSELENTSYLNLDDNNIISLKDLKNLDQLFQLSLKNNNITDLSDIYEFKKLYSLNLDENDVVDVTPLNKIKELNILSLVGNKKITGKLTGNISYLNLRDCNLNNSYDLSGLKKLVYINISNNNYSDVNGIIKNTESSWISIDADDLVITEEQLNEINNSKQEEKSWFIDGANFDLFLNMDSNNNISLNNNYFVRKLLMQQIMIGLDIENGNIDNKVEFIHVLNSNNDVSFKVNSSVNHYGLIDVNISH